jgi:catechol 2,3-dioxygenase-like lactoylglutathione lyase family enzyme
MSTHSSTTPAIVAPVSRQLSVADLARSIAFYRDILGFDVRHITNGDGVSAQAEAVAGPARIQFTTEEKAIDSALELRPRGSAIMFFETNDVAGMRDAVRARGGQPSELEKANWIKMQLFEIRDPDGHTLWFAQSFQQPDAARPEPMLKDVLPELPHSNVKAGIAHYLDVLGFQINYARDDFGVLFRDDVTVLIVPRSEAHKGIGSCYVYIDDADALHAELRAKGANVQSEPVSHPWGLRDFAVLDLEGNKITFGQPFE